MRHKKIKNIFLWRALLAQQNEVSLDPVGQVSVPTSDTSLCPYNFFGLFYFVLGSLPDRFGVGSPKSEPALTLAHMSHTPHTDPILILPIYVYLIYIYRLKIPHISKDSSIISELSLAHVPQTLHIVAHTSLLTFPYPYIPLYPLYPLYPSPRIYMDLD